jgi:hypothetical protein
MKKYNEILIQVNEDFGTEFPLLNHMITGINYQLQKYNDNFYELSKESIAHAIRQNMSISTIMVYYSDIFNISDIEKEQKRFLIDEKFIEKYCQPSVNYRNRENTEYRLYYHENSYLPYFKNIEDVYNFTYSLSLHESKDYALKLLNFIGLGNFKRYLFKELQLTNDVYYLSTELRKIIEIDDNNNLVYTDKEVIGSNHYRMYRLCNHTKHMFNVYDINYIEVIGFGIVIDHEEILENYYYSNSESNFYVTEDYYYDNRYEEEEEEEEEVYLRSYHNNQSLTHTFNNESLFRIGFEVEKEDFDILQSISINDFESETNYRKESDGSLCSDSGFELISPIYEMNTEKIIQHISENRIIVNHLNASANYRTCGTHINISKIDESGFSLYPYIENYLPMLYAMYPNRTKTDYCKAKSKENIKNDNEKYQAVKIHDNRIELRIFPVVHSAKQLFFRLQLVELMLKNPIENFTEFTKVFEWYFKPFLLGSKVYDSEKLSKLQTRISHYAIKYNFLEDSEDSENQFFDN